MSEKPFAPACERNAPHIYEILQKHLSDDASILEIGSGTGQHAVYFAQQGRNWHWQCSDRAEYLPGIRDWLNEIPGKPLPEPLELDVFSPRWPQQSFDAVFSANTLHIMPWEGCVALFSRLADRIKAGGKLLVYGPFNYAGEYTSPSNAQFDVWLKQTAAHQGIRDFEAVDALAQKAGLKLLNDHDMPANNRLICWQKPKH